MASQKNDKSNIKRLTIATVILLLSLFTLLRTGAAVAAMYNGLYFIFGSITTLLLILIIYFAVMYIIDVNYKFYRSRLNLSIGLILLAVLMFVSLNYMKTVGLDKTYFDYLDKLSYAHVLNGGAFGYLVTKPVHALIGSFGVYIVATLVACLGGYLLYTEFYAVDGDIQTLIASRIKPKQNTEEDRRRRTEERRARKEEKLLQRQLEEEDDDDDYEYDDLEDDNTDVKQEKRSKDRPAYLDYVIKKEEDSDEPDFTIREVKPEDDKSDIYEIKKEEPIAKPEEVFEMYETGRKPKKELKPKTKDEAVNQLETEIERLKAELNPATPVNVMKIEGAVEKTATSDSDYKIPPIDLLSDGMKDLEALKRLETVASENAKILEMTLDSFNLKAKIINVSIGPNITKYELQPEIGTKVNRFSSLSNDLAMALAATSIRIEAPIPGKAAVGIEIPNKEILSVSLKEVLTSANNDMDKKLQVAMGKDISGDSIFMEINKTPHMLVAGATGSGKSVSINSFILSVLLKATPDEVKMIMIDPKKVELAPYNGIPHLLTPVVTEPKRAAVILKKMVAEMEMRYELFSKTNTRNIEGFNKKIKKDNPDNWNKLPYIVIIIDELADLMMVASAEVETSIARLAQMARAAGIHLVIATQRPSTDVITGLIKSNIPTRLSFSVSSSIDSRTILDQSGAEKLLGKGDMLYAANGSNSLVRIQGTFVSDDEIMEVVDYITAQNYGAEDIKKQQEEFEATIEAANESAERDDLFDEAVETILAANSASTSLLQRRLRIGFNRASSIMEQMEEAGIVSANEGTKPRRILISSYGEDNEEQY